MGMGNSWIIAILVATECTDVGLNTLAKAATRQGMSEFVFVVYSSAMALLFLLPSTFVFHRPCPQLTFSIVCRIFVLGLLSVIGAAVIAVGFYAVLWGKAKEEKDVKDHEICSFDESSDRIPLLQNTSVHV